jgi:hypothetical protein
MVSLCVNFVSLCVRVEMEAYTLRFTIDGKCNPVLWELCFGHIFPYGWNLNNQCPFYVFVSSFSL